MSYLGHNANQFAEPGAVARMSADAARQALAGGWSPLRSPAANETLRMRGTPMHVVDMTRNINLTLDWSGARAGLYVIVLRQDASGGRTVTTIAGWPTSTAWSGTGGELSVNPMPRGVTAVRLYYTGATVYGLDQRQALTGDDVRFSSVWTALPAWVTFTRASNAAFFDFSGNLQTASSNAARVQSYVGDALLGWLLEETRSNPLNTALTGGSAGIPGTQPTGWIIVNAPSGMQRSLDYGTEDGMPCVDVRLSGTVPSGSTDMLVTFSTASAIAAAAGQTWTQSFFAKLVAGNWDNVVPSSSPVSRRSAGVLENFGQVIYPTSNRLASQRFARTFTVTSDLTTSVQPRIRFALTAGTAVDFTVRLAWPQISQHAFATSPIAGGTTRATESALITGSDFSDQFGAVTGTTIIEFTPLAASSMCVLSIDDGTANNRMQLRVASGGAANLRVVSGGSGIYDGGPSVASLPRKMALRRSSAGVSAWVNGALIVDLGITPPTVTRAQIGGGVGSDAFSGHIGRLTLYPGIALPDDICAELTT